MNDCPNAEIRDQLPDLLHDRLDAASARPRCGARRGPAWIAATSSSCCGRARCARSSATPRVDVAIVGALPKPRRARDSELVAASAVGGLARRRGRGAVVVGGKPYSQLGRHGRVAVRDPFRSRSHQARTFRP